ncbi:MAG: dihydroorotase [Lachnospiraceae bacterium]
MILIRNGYVIDPKSEIEEQMDILIDGGTIVKMGKNLLPTLIRTPDKTIHADGLMIAPGLVDVHVHFRDPGFTEKEDIATGARAAAKGGFTSVVLMANTKPVVDTVEILSYVLEQGKKTGIHVYSCATATKGMQGEQLSDMQNLAEHQAVGFTDDGVALLRESVVREAMCETRRLQVPLSLHEENPNLIMQNGINAGQASSHYGIEGSPREAEITMVKRDLELAIETGAIVNMQHISTRESVALIREAKKHSSNIHAEATPHHFTLTEEATITKGSLAKMNPPLRTEQDRQAIIEGLQDGTIDLIATDHAPHTKTEKDRPITEAPSGIVGLETAFSLGITHLVHKNQMSFKELIRKMSYNPARLYQLNAGYLAEGAPADMIIFSPTDTWKVSKLQSKSQNSPFLQETLDGVICYTISNGTVVYDNRKR